MRGRIFLLSPARCDGERAKLLRNPGAVFPLAVQLRTGAGAPLGDVFSFLSGLYFRGKLAYASAFGGALDVEPSTLVISADRGLVAPEVPVRVEDLERFAGVDIAAGDARYLAPLARDAAAVAARLGQARDQARDVVLLGSIATGKYVDVLLEHFGQRLLFPEAFVGRGDMSRGGLLLRHARAGTELTYTHVAGAVRRGRRPPKLEPMR